ncbi:response regulator transcription factor [Mesorhizobium sp. B4-1-1]|nr:response regulator transcription factor [Mesorhizobium sp. B4-1-1]
MGTRPCKRGRRRFRHRRSRQLPDRDRRGRGLNHVRVGRRHALEIGRNATDLLQAIRCVLAGDNYVDPALAARILSAAQGDPGNLSERERSVIQLVALGYSNKEIPSRLSLGIKTIETYRTRATDKLELHSRAAIVRFAHSNGWPIEPPVQANR